MLCMFTLIYTNADVQSVGGNKPSCSPVVPFLTPVNFFIISVFPNVMCSVVFVGAQYKIDGHP